MKRVVRMLLIAFLLSSSPVIYAQDEGPDPPPDYEDEGPDPPPPSAPINDWIPIAAVGAVLFVGRKYYTMQKGSSNNA